MVVAEGRDSEREWNKMEKARDKRKRERERGTLLNTFGQVILLPTIILDNTNDVAGDVVNKMLTRATGMYLNAMKKNITLRLETRP